MVVGSPVTFLPTLNFFHLLPVTLNLPDVSCEASQVVLVVKNPPANAGDLRDGVLKIPWSRAWQPTPVFLPGESPWTEEPGGL